MPDPQWTQQIFETLHEPLLVLDEDLRVHQANPAFHESFSTRPGEIVGTSLFEIGDGQFQDPELERCLEAVVGEGKSFQGLGLDRSLDGNRLVLRLNGRRLVGGGAESDVRVLLAIEDITEQRDLENKLRRRAKELGRSNEDLEQFAYAASHDLQEPLRMVSSYLQLLERRYKEDLDETAQEFIDYAVDGAGRMKRLINSLLQYSRVGRKEGEFGEVELGPLVDDVTEDLGRRIEETGAQVTRDDLPAVYGSRDQLRRVFQNLLENALTYHGEKPPRIHISSRKAEKGAHLTVEDKGPGIPPEATDKIFHIFRQLDPHGRGTEGSGMGLAITRKIVERHDGEIWAESEPGNGSVFHLTLALRPPARSK